MKLWTPLAWVWSAWAAVCMVVLTGIFGGLTFLMSFLRVKKLHWVPRTWAWLLSWSIGCPIRVSGMENIDQTKPYIFASNHASALDILALQTTLPANFRWMAKKELFEIFFFGSALLRCGYISVDRSNRREASKSLDDALVRIRRGASVVIFPEGTRSRDGKLLPFKWGGFHLAIKSGCPVVPLGIKGSFEALPPYKYPLYPRPIEVKVGRPIPTEGIKPGDRKILSAQVRVQILELLGQEEEAE